MIYLIQPVLNYMLFLKRHRQLVMCCKRQFWLHNHQYLFWWALLGSILSWSKRLSRIGQLLHWYHRIRLASRCRKIQMCCKEFVTHRCWWRQLRLFSYSWSKGCSLLDYEYQSQRRQVTHLELFALSYRILHNEEYTQSHQRQAGLKEKWSALLEHPM